MFRFLFGLMIGIVLGAIGMAYLWWQDEQQRGELGSPEPPHQA